MITVEGQYFDGRQPVGVPARMDFFDQEAALTAGPLSERYVISHLKVSPRIGSADRFITFPGGAQLACADHALFDSLPQESPSEGLVAWLEERWPVALGCVAIVVCALLGGYLFGLPLAADRIAARIPMSTELSLGEQSLTWLDKNGWFGPTRVEAHVQEVITDGFDRLRGGLPLANYHRLEFRSTRTLGPNALALPGGIIVLTDEMVKAGLTTEEILAVLAHEIGHVELRHTMRSVLQNSAVAAAAAVLTADAASLSVAIAALPTMVAQMKYSREFEAAADDFAFRLLRQKGYSPTAFASLMKKLAEKGEDRTGPFAYLSTHPVTAERIQRARNAAER